MAFEAVIGLEVHVQLATASKLFCRCPNRFGADPNSLVCPVCLGYPGTLPVVNRRAVDLAVTLALALGAEVHERSGFARKSYFYPDLPKGYQITQLEPPLATGGRLPLAAGGAVAVSRLHLEEDAGKLLHDAEAGDTLVDFNRCGVPLVELVTEPELGSPEEARTFLRALHQLLLYTRVSAGNLEEGNLRCDANVSLRRRGGPLGTRTEIKNLNSYRHLVRALGYEIERQRGLLGAGRPVERETRTYDQAAGVTAGLRGKEEARDYRYFPEPDLPPLTIDGERRRRLAEELPEPPWERRQRLQAAGLAATDAAVLTATPELAAYTEAAVAAYSGAPRVVAGWVRTEVLAELHRRGLGIERALPPRRLAELVRLIDEGVISRRAAQPVLAAVWSGDESPRQAVVRLGLGRVEDPERIAGWVRRCLDDHPQEAARWQAGEDRLSGFFTGRVMALSGGRAAPERVAAALRRARAAAARSVAASSGDR